MATAAALSVMCVKAQASENICAQPDVAKMVIEAFNGLPLIKDNEREQVVDIYNISTIIGRDGSRSCHGVFQLKAEGVQEGTITFKTNIAGDTVVQWTPGPLSDSLSSGYSSDPNGQQILPPSNYNASFQNGSRDRQAWEVWFNGLSGEERDGAYYWAAQRSLSHPGSCARLGGEGQIGCLEAKMRLDQSDARRKSDPLYKAGWNSAQSNS